MIKLQLIRLDLGAQTHTLSCRLVTFTFFTQFKLHGETFYIPLSQKCLSLCLRIQMNAKNKVNEGLPNDDIPRLVHWAARTKEGIDTMFDALESQPLDAEYVGLLHNIQSEEIQGYLYRGYTILTKGDQNQSANKVATCLTRAAKRYDRNKLPVIWLFSGMLFRCFEHFDFFLAKF